MADIHSKTEEVLKNTAEYMNDVFTNALTDAQTLDAPATTPQVATFWDNWLWLIVFAIEMVIVALFTFIFWIWLKQWVKRNITDVQNGTPGTGGENPTDYQRAPDAGNNELAAQN